MVEKEVGEELRGWMEGRGSTVEEGVEACSPDTFLNWS